MTAKPLAFAALLLGAAYAAAPAQADELRFGLAPDAPAAVVPAYTAPQYRCTGGEFGRPKYCYKVPMVRRPSITI
jgi:hypothetical protein